MPSPPLTRKRFLGLAAASAAAVGTGGLVACRRASSSDPDVIVVGAGLAGLTAAYELERDGRDVVVVEARNRLGGRVDTIRSFAGGQYAEGGGEYVDWIHTSLRAYCSRFGIPLVRADRGFGGLRSLVLYDGELVDPRVFRSGRAGRDLDEFLRLILRQASRVDPRDPVGSAPELDEHNVEEVVAAIRPSPQGRFLIENYVRDYYAAEPEALSLLYLATQEQIYRDVPASQIEHHRIRGGSDRLVQAFAERLSDIRTGAPVRSVDYGDQGVEITAGEQTVRASAAVLAAPLPALAMVEFEPALPPVLAAGRTGLTYGRVTKNLIQTDPRVWRTEGYTGDLISDTMLGSSWEATDQQPGREGILIAYAAGDFSPYYERLAPEERTADAASRLNDVFPGFAADAGTHHSVSWPIERYSGGSWIAPGPGELTRYWSALREPVGPLYLAGEHTAVLSGYMESAIRSGRRAAAEVVSASR